MWFVVSDSCHKYISDGIICQVTSCSSSVYTVVSGAAWGLEVVLYDLMLCPLVRLWSLQLLSGVRHSGSILLSLMPRPVANPSVQAVLLLGPSLQMTGNGKNLPPATSDKLKGACFFLWLWRCGREVYSGYLSKKDVTGSSISCPSWGQWTTRQWFSCGPFIIGFLVLSGQWKVTKTASHLPYICYIGKLDNSLQTKIKFYLVFWNVLQ